MPSLESLPWIQEVSKSGILTRYTAWLVAPPCVCHYKYGKGNKDHPSTVFPSWLAELTDAVASAIGVSASLLNSVNCNKYVTSSHNLYWHSDNEDQFRLSETDRDTLVVSLSLGASRKFGIRRKQSLDPNDESSVILDNGDICVMLECHFEHMIFGGVSTGGGAASSSSSSSALGQRINLTWRFQQRHERACPANN